MGLRFSGKNSYSFIGGIIEIEKGVMRDKEAESRNQDIVIVLRSLLKKKGLSSLFLIQNDEIYALVIQEGISNSTAVIKQALVYAIRELEHFIGSSFSGDIEIYAGFGRVRTKVTEVIQSFNEAGEALRVNRARNTSIIPFYEDLGVYQLITVLPEETVLSPFISLHLGKILQYDRENKSELLRTLDEFLKCRGSKQETATRLYIHRQTLYHRLEKLEELLGENFLEQEQRLCIEFALRAYEMVSPLMRKKGAFAGEGLRQ
nr:helix-turn-helix domain-containing protein [Bacillus sp. 165]